MIGQEFSLTCLRDELPYMQARNALLHFINASINIDEEGLHLLLETTDRDVGDSLLNYSMPAPRQAVRLETQERYSA